jgi:hypothetical protein
MQRHKELVEQILKEEQWFGLAKQQREDYLYGLSTEELELLV